MFCLCFCRHAFLSQEDTAGGSCIANTKHKIYHIDPIIAYIEKRIGLSSINDGEIIYSYIAQIITDHCVRNWFSVSKCVRQGCIMSSQLFSVYADSIMREVEEEQNNTEYD